MITTRNRSANLQQTLRTIRSMAPPPDELLVTLDACNDDSLALVRKEFPEARVIINEIALGSVASRKTMLQQARGNLVVSLDDDSYPLNPAFFGRLPDLFDSHPEAAVIAFPELRDSGRYSAEDKTPSVQGHYTSAYANCAAAMRRHFYLQQAGFTALFHHMYEEPDYALQCYAAGASVWFEPSMTIRHHLSSDQRKPMRRHHQNACNELWSVWMRCPWPQLVVVSFFRIWRQFRYACSEGWHWAIREPAWWIKASAGLLSCLKQRQPVPWKVYLAWMRLARSPANSLSDLRKTFPTFS